VSTTPTPLDMPDVFSFVARNAQTLTWHLETEGDLVGSPMIMPVPIDDAVLTATLYAGRNRQYPEITPGSPVPGFTALTLSHISNGNYTVEIDASMFDPTEGPNYLLVVDAVQDSTGREWHWERPSEVILP
jgi:hypothetical protein